MKTKIYPLTSLRSFLIAVILAGSGLTALGQTGNVAVIQQPCNDDGIILTTITSGMTPPLTFTYYNHANTVHISPGYTDTYNGEYIPYVFIYDGFGHQLSLSTSPMAPPFTTNNPIITNAICPNNGSAEIHINGGVFPDYVDWYNNAQPFPGVLIGTGNPMSLPGGVYNAKIFNGGCSAFYDSTINIENISPLVVNITTTPANCTNGTATITGVTGGTPPYTYLWWNGATTATVTGLSQGIFSVTVTDAGGCYRQQQFYINQVVQIPVNIVVTQQPTCLQNDGILIAFGSGGANPYAYHWNDGQTTQQAINLVGGTTSSVIVTDANGCTGSGSKYLTSSTPIVVTYAATPSSCTAATGTATLTVNGGLPPYVIAWNTYPQQSGLTAINLQPGNYGFIVTDVNGCVQTGQVHIPPQSVINASIFSTNALCPLNSGSAGVSCSGVSPFSFLWNTAATTQNITGLTPGTYSCVITDANSCSVTKYTQVYSTSPVVVGMTSVPATCLYATDGSLQASPSGGTPPYTYSWSNGTTANPAINLAPGHYWVIVTDNSGCSTLVYAIVGNSATSDACYCRIDGHVYNDPLTTCSGSGLTGIEHIQVHLAPFGYTWTDANGYFSFLVPTGNYTLSENVQYIYPLNSCPSNDPVPISVTASSGCVYSNDFFDTVNPLHDIHVIPIDPAYAIPGFSYYQQIFIQNDGTVQEPDILLNYCPDPALGTFSSFPAMVPGSPCYYNPSGIVLNPGEATTCLITYTFPVPTNIPLGTLLNYTGIGANAPPISNWLNDYTPWNNYQNWQETVVGSYDPNFKEVFPAGTGTEGAISVNDSVLDYIIHFQNTGTYYAENIELIDTLDPSLDWTTLQPGYSNHTYTAELSETGVLKFHFQNIHLVWEAENEINSNAMVTYSIKQKKNLPIGTKIHNTASIYFDFNAPVLTNTTLNTIAYPVGGSLNKAKYGITVYPDPVTRDLFINTGDFGTPTGISVCDLAGRMVIKGTVSANPVQKVPVSDLAPGMYFITLVNVNGEKVSSKFVKD